jgi:hypothetical protein
LWYLLLFYDRWADSAIVPLNVPLVLSQKTSNQSHHHAISNIRTNVTSNVVLVILITAITEKEQHLNAN